jgi:hypothetical protein
MCFCSALIGRADHSARPDRHATAACGLSSCTPQPGTAPSNAAHPPTSMQVPTDLLQRTWSVSSILSIQKDGAQTPGSTLFCTVHGGAQVRRRASSPEARTPHKLDHCRRHRTYSIHCCASHMTVCQDRTIHWHRAATLPADRAAAEPSLPF